MTLPHFAPTQKARENLLREGVVEEKILVTGNTVIDALQWVASQPCPQEVEHLLISKEGGGNPNSEIRNILVTAHRRENFGEPLENICLALREISRRYHGQVRIIYPVHLNPNVWKPVHRLLEGNSQITLIPPLDYLLLVHLMKKSYLVLTDSGGIQEEAPGLGIPVLVLREKTERPEAVEAGTVRLVGTKAERIIAETSLLLDNLEEYNKMAKAANPYGDGRASQRIISAPLGEPVEPFVPSPSHG
ncbi:MAG: non-hydrolyzing UDP-N-acetylglucosamine 2-epimerase [Thermodesulfobacteriota bacterium]